MQNSGLCPPAVHRACSLYRHRASLPQSSRLASHSSFASRVFQNRCTSHFNLLVSRKLIAALISQIAAHLTSRIISSHLFAPCRIQVCALLQFIGPVRSSVIAPRFLSPHDWRLIALSHLVSFKIGARLTSTFSYLANSSQHSSPKSQHTSRLASHVHIFTSQTQLLSSHLSAQKTHISPLRAMQSSGLRPQGAAWVVICGHERKIWVFFPCRGLNSCRKFGMRHHQHQRPAALLGLSGEGGGGGEGGDLCRLLRTATPPTSSTCCELRHHQHQRRAALLGLSGEDLARAARAGAAATCAGCCDLRS